MSESRTLIQGTRLRATRVDGCGVPMDGPEASIVTKGFISVAMKDNVEAGEEFKTKLADGTYCVNQRSKSQLNWIELAITMCAVNPESFNLLSGSPIVYDDAVPTPNAIGIGTDGSTYASASFALELWTNLARTAAQACSGVGVRYGYLLLPWVVEGTIGDLTVENAVTNFTLNSITSTGNDWGIGPYNVNVDRFGDPSPLFDAIPHDRHRLIQFTNLAPPEPADGYVAVVPVS